MERTVITPRDVQNLRSLPPTSRDLGTAPSATSPVKADDYKDQLLKYIPAETVALYLTLQGIVQSLVANKDQLPTFLLVIFVVGLIGTPLYLLRIAQVTKTLQIVISTIAFVIWVLALGGWFATQSWYQPVIGALALPIYTFAVPIITGGPQPNVAAIQPKP